MSTTLSDPQAGEDYSATVHSRAVRLIESAIEMTTEAGSGHPTSAASLAHLVAVLLYDHMRYDRLKPRHPLADRLVLSEGHAVPIIYAAAADIGIVFDSNRGARVLTSDDTLTLREIDSSLEGHPIPARGFSLLTGATGSLGQGLSIAAGLAAAARLDGVDNRVFCLIGDGESREGQIWEALDFIVDHALVRVCPIFNGNGYGQSDRVSLQQSPQRLQAKLEACGFTVELIDGHDPLQIRSALDHHARASDAGQPLAIVARTVKGWGAPSMQGSGLHGKPMAEGQVGTILGELRKTAAALNARNGRTGRELEIPGVPKGETPSFGLREELPLTLDHALKILGDEEVLEKGRWPTRKAYGLALRALGRADERVVALDGDVKNSTYAQTFAGDPELAERFFECKIAEQNMISAAAGLALGGRIPFASSFAKFITRGYDQLEMALNSQANLKVVGSHSGVSLAADGPSQMGLPDVAWFRAWTSVERPDGKPCLYLLHPADAYSAYALTLRMADHDGACYLRTLRPDVPFLYDNRDTFRLGGHSVVQEGSDLLIVSAGYALHEVLKAVPELVQKHEIEPTVVDLYSIPFDHDELRQLARENGSRVLTVEDNYGGGIASALAEVLAESGMPCRFRSLCVRRIPKSGRTPDDLMEFVGLNSDDIREQAVRLTELEPSTSKDAEA